ncbi:hypothetical protein MSAN_00890400 [Mycena sanguinolenta]|uniref:HD domain-containing protein n=1 Tax=Mycena sanguinolenta TaxID=230812 RepID=A0A8H7D9J7_9AGAR|nr:hypothetical protein MSAN_00890400 [Mycena sanguinolenta]
MPFTKTYDAYVPSDGKEFFTLANFVPNYVPLAELQAIPLDDAHRDSCALAEKITPPATFVHCSRVYFFGIAMLYNGFPSESPGVPQITLDELVRRWYHCAMLHDLGLTKNAEALEHPANAMSFELHGGFMAYDHLHAADPTLDPIQVGDIVQGIILHTSSFHSGKSSAVSMLLKMGTAFDGLGYDAFGPGSLSFLQNRKTVQEIEAAFPRGAFGEEALDIVATEMARKPDCLMSHGMLDFIPRIAALKFIVPPDEVCQ